MPTAVLDVTGLRTRSPRWQMLFVRKMKAIGADPNMVAAVISFETGGTFDPTTRNPISDAVGLIQWTKGGAKTHDLDRETIALMDDEQQLELVQEWFGRFGSRLGGMRPVDYYLAVFAPNAIGVPDGGTVYDRDADGLKYEQNKSLDSQDDGVISVADIRRHFEPVILRAKKLPPVIVVDERWPWLVGGMLITAAAGGAAYRMRRRWS